MIALASDHGGFELKESVKKKLDEMGQEYKDFGTYSSESADYALYAVKAAGAVARGEADKGILICSTGLGICMAANKVKGIRAAACTDLFSAEMTRRHNNANVLCMGAMLVDEEKAFEIVEKFLTTDFEGGRHQRRIDQIAQIEDGSLN